MSDIVIYSVATRRIRRIIHDQPAGPVIVGMGEAFVEIQRGRNLFQLQDDVCRTTGLPLAPDRHALVMPDGKIESVEILDPACGDHEVHTAKGLEVIQVTADVTPEWTYDRAQSKPIPPVKNPEQQSAEAATLQAESKAKP